MTELFAYFSGLIVAVLATPGICRVANSLRLVDQPDARKMHRLPTPRVGGVAIVAGMLVSVLAAAQFWPAFYDMLFVAPSGLPTLLVAGLLVFAMGLADDLHGLSSRFKLLLLVGAAVAVCRAGIRIQIIDIGETFRYDLGWLSWPVTILWIVVMTVSVNFIDGLDGLAAGIAVIACGVIAVVCLGHNDIAIVVLALALMGSLSGFLFFNRHPARIFMGDGGSMFLGFMLASMSAAGTARSGRFADVAITAMAMGVPLVDTAWTMFRRGVLQRRSVFSAERGHIHHCMIDLGFGHWQAVLTIHSVTVLCAGLALLSLYLDSMMAKLSITAGVFILVTLFIRTGAVSLRRAWTAIARHIALCKSERGDRRTFEDMQLAFQRLSTFDEWWRQVQRAAELLGFQRIALPIHHRNGSEVILSWEAGEGNRSEVLETVIPLRSRRAGDDLRVALAVRADGSAEIAARRLMFFSRLVEEYGLVQLGGKNNGHDQARRSQWLRDANGHEQLADDPAGTPRQKGRRVAVVHDFLYTYAGAERVLEQILQVYPEADVFSLFDFLPPDQRKFLMGKQVHSTFLQRMPFIRTKHRGYLPFMPLAVEQLDMSAYDVVISSSYCAAKGILTRPDQLHICYCHTPIRFAWDLQHQYLSESGLSGGLKSILARIVLHYIRGWDVRSANGVDAFVTNSDYVGRRIQKVYRRTATTVYPPVDIEKFEVCRKKEDFYLTVSRMVPYKKIPLIAQAFAHLGDHKLVIIGDGPQMDAVRAVAGPNVQILGYQDFEVLHDYMRRAKAFIFAAEEDFGIVPVEAQACGTPVIAFGQGGATESVVEGVTGLFFHKQTPESLVEAVLDFEAIGNWDAEIIRRHAEKFNAARFRKQFASLVEREWTEFNRHRPNEEFASLTLVGGDPERKKRRIPAPVTIPNDDDLDFGAVSK